MSDFQASYMSAITKNLDEYFVCRMPDCVYIGRNTDWADNVKGGGGHYACPRCGTWHQPFKAGTDGRLSCNKVMVVQVTAGNKALSLDGKVALRRW